MSGGPESLADDPIEEYLDRLLISLPGSPRQVRHALDEVGAHLRDAAAQAVTEGMGETDARAAAVSRLGPPAGVVDRPVWRLRLTPARRCRLLLGALVVAGVAGTAVGAAAVLGGIVRAVWGDRVIATPFPVGSYMAADCTRWLANEPAAHGCPAAMTADHAADFLMNAAACGVVGLVALAIRAGLRRRWSGRAVAAALPRGTEEAVGVVLATIATIVLLGQGIDAVVVIGGDGAGQAFVLAATAAAAAVFLAVRAHRTTARPLLPYD